MFNILKHKPGKISGEDLDEMNKTSAIEQDAQRPLLGTERPPSTETYQAPEEQEDPFNPSQPNVLPAGGVIGAQPETAQQGEIDPRLTHELGTDALHGVEINSPE